MSFNKNSSKRLSIIAGIERESVEIAKAINYIAIDFVKNVLQDAISVVLFSKRKKITVADIQFLSQISERYPPIVTSSKLKNLVSVCVNKDDLNSILRGNKGYKLYTLKNPFIKLLKELLLDLEYEEMHISSNVPIVLQCLTEHYIVTIMNLAFSYTWRDNRGTLLLDDLKMALKCKGIGYNEEKEL